MAVPGAGVTLVGVWRGVKQLQDLQCATGGGLGALHTGVVAQEVSNGRRRGRVICRPRRPPTLLTGDVVSDEIGLRG